MSIKFVDCDEYTNYVAKTDNETVIGSIDIENGMILFNDLDVSEIEQILTKMKELQENNNNKGIQIGNNNTQINTFK